MNHITIAPASVSDVPEVQLLLSSLYRELGYRAPARSVDPAHITGRIFDTASTLLVAYYDAHPIGVLTCSYPEGHRRENNCVIDELFVLPPFRHLGVGEFLMQKGIELAQGKGWNSLSTGLNDRCTSVLSRAAAFPSTSFSQKSPGAAQGMLFH